MSENLSKLSARKGLKENLFEAIQEYTADPDNIKQIAKSWKIGEAPVYSAATSYDFITGNQANKKAYVCNGSSCLCAGEQDQVSEKLSECFGAENIGHMTCLGRCHENAAFHINGVNYSGDAINHLDDILDNQTAKTDNLSHDNYAVTALTETPILTKPIGNLSDFYQLFNELIQQFSREDLLKQMIESGLRGRGGAGFPAGIKWQSCAQIIDDQKYIVCNADEGDPGAFSDRYLLEQQPHLVLFGMLISGYLVGANHGVLYIRAEYPDSIAMTNQAIKDFEQLNILPADFDFKFKVVAGAGAYICGEETALLRSLEGQKPMVSVRPPFPTVKGLFGKPTVVNNVETFASVHWILTQGAEAYKKIGNGKSTGTKLVCL
ncbi:MAG: NAD(P)H-dependent oxidoreductase subunit E, partial [Gammaproteobacteria bacterium]|nr:NAD(P)H-dependent oxidoreductase subunit E [Gammaproteobacteria bacterium]